MADVLSAAVFTYFLVFHYFTDRLNGGDRRITVRTWPARTHTRARMTRKHT